MLVFVKHLSGKTTYLEIEPSDTVFTAKRKIEKKEGTPLYLQRMVFEGRDLADGRLFSDYNVQSEATIHLVLRLSGGGFSPITFNSLNEPIIGKFTSTAPNWRKLHTGLNLEGKCKTKTCEAFGKKVWIPKGFGTFTMNKVVFLSRCPMCNGTCDEVKNMALYLARCLANGLKKGEETEVSMQSEHTNAADFLTFEDKDETRIEWIFLEMKVSEL